MAVESGTEEKDDYLYSEDLYINLPEEKFSCPICLCPVQREAHLTGCCGKHFCFKCIGRVKNGNKPCPMCNAAPVAIFPNKERQREINQVEVRCPLNILDVAEGAHKCECDWKGELGSAKHHVIEKHGTEVLRRLNGTEEKQETQLAAKLSHQCQVVDLGRDVHTCHVSAQHISVHSTTCQQVPVSTSAPQPPSLTPHPSTPPHTPPTEEPLPNHPYLPHQPFPPCFHRCHPHPPHHPPPHHPPHHPHPHHPHPHPPHHFPHRPHFPHPHHPPPHPPHGHHFPHGPPHHHHPHHHPPHRPPHPHSHPPHHCRPHHPFP